MARRDDAIPSRIPRGRARTIRSVPGLSLVAIGPMRSLPKVARWTASCTSDGEDAVQPTDMVVLFESMGHVPVCYLLRNLAEQLYDQHVAQEPLVDVRGNAITAPQFRVVLSAARAHLPDFRDRYARTEITRVSNRLVKPMLLRHHARLDDAKRRWMSGDMDRGELKRVQIASANEFDTYYTEVKGRAKRIFEHLGPNETLTPRKVARNDAEYREALEVERATTSS